MGYNKTFIGIFCMILGVFSLGINDVLVKGLSFNFPIWEIVFFRALSGVIISIFLLIIFGFSCLKTKKPIAHTIRAFSSVACVVLFFFGIKFLLLSENQAIFHSSPIIATILAIPILGEKIGWHRFCAVIFGFIGVVIILKPGTDLFKIYSLIPIAASFFMAFAYLATRYLMSTESSVAIIFYYSVALLLTSLCFVPSNFIFPSILECIPLFLLGVFGSVGHFFLSQAAKNAEVMVITPFEYTSFIFVTILGYIIFREVPDITIYIGIIFIVISGIYIVYREQKNIKKI